MRKQDFTGSLSLGVSPVWEIFACLAAQMIPDLSQAARAPPPSQYLEITNQGMEETQVMEFARFSLTKTKTKWEY